MPKEESSDDETINSDDKNEEDNESSILSPVPTPSLKSIGPPTILKYQPESKKVELLVPTPGERYEEPPEDVTQFFKDYNVYLNGGNICEFCDKNTLPWPSIQEQETEQPSSVREFIHS